MNIRYDWLIVGAGLTGSVIAERLANEYDRKVLVIDRRDHIGGNVYDERNEHGILYHKYGPHIFHTNSQIVVQYLSRFTEWIDYEHRVVGVINDRLVPIPFNLTSIEILFPDEADSLKTILIDTYGINVKVPILQLMNSEDKKLKIYQNLSMITSFWVILQNSGE
jgi:UDP-galactopyranose mutase